MWGLRVTLFHFDLTTPCHDHTFRIHVLALEIPLLTARYHGYLFRIQTLRAKKLFDPKCSPTGGN